MQLHESEQPTLAGLSKVLEDARVRCGIPGMSVAVLYKGELIYDAGFGKRNESEPFTPQTLTSIASVTKAFTATAIGELVAEGKMDWDTTPVSQYLPGFELKDQTLTSQLTLADLLSHRSGLPNVDLAWFRNTESTRDLIKRLKHVDISPKLGSKCLYNNVMYAVAGEAGANVAGIPYEELVKTKVLKPLGMTRSGFSAMEMKTHADHAMPYLADSLKDAQDGRFTLGYLDDIYMADAAAGDIYSNVLDLVRWGSAVMHGGEIDGKQVLNKENIQETLTAHTFRKTTRRAPDFAPALAYGLGWMIDSYKGRTVYYHGGSNPGFISNVAMFPDDDLVVAHLTNIDATKLPANVPYLIADRLLCLPKTQDWVEVSIKETQEFYDLLKAASKIDLPEQRNGPPTHPLHEYVGEYSNPVYGKVSVRLENEKNIRGGGGGEGGEALYFKMRTLDSRMNHYHFDTFTAALKDFALQLGAVMTFQIGESGQVEGLRFMVQSDIVEFKREQARRIEE
ncbi:hypothetical protein BGZ75_000090 [Mortierella antarctica]|nr:hypothetical protein BGZ75_000090 [Mortierella antarctica]